MVIDRAIGKFVVPADESIRTALRKIDANKSRIIFSVHRNGVLEGVVTDGDFRRAVLKSGSLNLDQAVSSISNKRFDFASIDADPEDVGHRFSERIQFVPLLDDEHRLVAIARQGVNAIEIGPFTISDQPPVFVIAEIGVNHNGSVQLAKEMADAAKEAGADCVKFQVRTLTALYRNRGDASDASEDLGSQYVLDVLTRSDLKPGEYLEIFSYCERRSILPLCSAWDSESVAYLEANANLAAYKVASADLTNHDLLSDLTKTGKPLLVSTGMSTEAEIKGTAAFLRKRGAPFILLQCNSTYPAPFKDVHLNYLDRLKKIGECPVGYSGHERGIHVAIAAVAKGATVVEKHFTFDRSMPGNDHKVSLLPDEFHAMVEGIRQVEDALGSDAERKLSQGELMNRATLAKSLIATRTIEPGTVIEESMVTTKSPGKGLQPNRRKELIGRKAKRPLRPGDFFFESDIAPETARARSYHFARPWGLPVRFHDFRSLLQKSNPDFLEFHLSYKDLELDWKQYITEPLDLGLTVHSPDVFSGDHLLNLAAEDEGDRQRSITELQRVINLTRALKPLFRKAEKPFVIASVGGYTKDAFIDSVTRERWYDRIGESLRQLDAEGVEILPQTLPPFPWYFGGQLFLNLLVTPEDTATFCGKFGMRLCFDVSHSKLTCNNFHTSFNDFVETIGPHIAHLHIVDAKGIDGEGVQIGEGDIDFPALAEQLQRIAPNAPFIPEIWQGHKNDGQGFWIALERLEEWFGAGLRGRFPALACVQSSGRPMRSPQTVSPPPSP